MRAGWWKSLYVQVLVAIVAGVLLGYFDPKLGEALKPLGDAFIALVKMIIAPVIFLTVALGIAQMGDLKKVGRVGLKAVIYFEVLTTIALVIGMLGANGITRGVGLPLHPGFGIPTAASNPLVVPAARSSTPKSFAASCAPVTSSPSRSARITLRAAP